MVARKAIGLGFIPMVTVSAEESDRVSVRGPDGEFRIFAVEDHYTYGMNFSDFTKVLKMFDVGFDDRPLTRILRARASGYQKHHTRDLQALTLLGLYSVLNETGGLSWAGLKLSLFSTCRDDLQASYLKISHEDSKHIVIRCGEIANDLAKLSSPMPLFPFRFSVTIDDDALGPVELSKSADLSECSEILSEVAKGIIEDDCDGEDAPSDSSAKKLNTRRQQAVERVGEIFEPASILKGMMEQHRIIQFLGQVKLKDVVLDYGELTEE